MTKPLHERFRRLRLKAGLSVHDAARLLCEHPVSVRKHEMNPASTTTSRNASALALKVLNWYVKKTPPSLEGKKL